MKYFPNITKRSLFIYGLLVFIAAINVVVLLWRRERLQSDIKSEKTRLRKARRQNTSLMKRVRRLKAQVKQREQISEVLTFARDRRRNTRHVTQSLAELQKRLSENLAFKRIKYRPPKLTVTIQGHRMSDLTHYAKTLPDNGINAEINNWVQNDHGATIELELTPS